MWDVYLFYMYLLEIITARCKYCYSDKCIEVFYPFLLHKKLDYSWFSAVVISNASYHNNYHNYGYGNIQMQYKVKGNNGYAKITFPFITLLKPEYPVDKIKEGMHSQDLFVMNSEKIYCLGICWVGSLQELLKHTTCSVYVLEDVYLRFKGQFDAVFSVYKENLNRFYVITDHSIAYQMYKEEKSV